MMERLGEMRKGKREKIEKGSRERIEIERTEKETKLSLDDNLKRKRNITTCLCSLFSSSRHCSAPPKTFLPRFCSKALQQ